MNYTKNFIATLLIFSTFFTAFAQEDIILKSQAEVDAFSKRMTTYDGSLYIEGENATDPITNLNALSNLRSVVTLYIGNNAKLTNVDGLSNLTSTDILTISNNAALRNIDGLSNLNVPDIYIYNNPVLGNCCGLQAMIATSEGRISIENNAPACSSKDNIVAAPCDTDSIGGGTQAIDEGVQLGETDYYKNIQRTRWELVDCNSNLNYKFMPDGSFTENGGNPGVYSIEASGITMSQKDKSGRHIITKMTANVMHLKGADGKDMVYGRKLDLSSKLAGTNWSMKDGGEEMRLKFLDGTNIEIIRVGMKGSKIPGTYAVDKEAKTLTVTLNSAKAAALGIEDATQTFNVKTFNFLMLKLREKGQGVDCFHRIR